MAFRLSDPTLLSELCLPSKIIVDLLVKADLPAGYFLYEIHMPMHINVEQVGYPSIKPLRELYRQEANCQIVHDSILERGMADPYFIELDGVAAGYGGVWNKIDTGCMMEFYTLPCHRKFAQPMCKELLSVSKAIGIVAQTNIPLMTTMLFDFATNIRVVNVLFEDAFTTPLTLPIGQFRHSVPGEKTEDWVIEVEGTTVAGGGFLCHYNPPYGDIFMNVQESERHKGYGSYLVQELKRVCYEAGKRPAARCNPGNVASRKTLEKAGLLPCARMLAGDVAVYLLK